MQPIARVSSLLLAAALLLTPVVNSQDNLELGKMWTFENAPREYFEETHGFALTDEWLDAVRAASLRFGRGCSASFVSPNGLVMTNHHCARGNIAKASPENEDWVKNGFVAATLADEVKLEGLVVERLISMTDVTDEMNAGIRDGDDAESIEAKRKSNQAAIIAEASTENPDTRPQVVTLFQGGNYQLYVYRAYTDVRLVCAPHLQTAHFGGDPDNFTYPRYGIDFTFCRAYENGKPADTSDGYFKFNAAGAVEGESVFITGNPGSTDRLMTLAQMEYLRDVRYPLTLELIDARLAGLHARAARGPEEEKAVRTDILGLENARKAYRGYYAGLLDPALMARKKAAEEAFRAKVAAVPELERRFGSAWDELRRISDEQRRSEPRRRHYNPLDIPHVQRAMRVLEAVDSGGTAERALEISTELSESAFENVKTRIANARRWLGEDDPWVFFVAGGSWADPDASTFDETSRIDDDAWVRRLVGGGKKAVEGSKDRAILAARLLRSLQERNNEGLARLRTDEAVEKTRVGQAVFAVYGNSVSPDATFTLRLSDGKVSGFPYNGTIAPWFTSFYGLYGRNVEFANEYPFDLPETWLERRDRIDMAKPVNFVATNDIIGGNSGSPVINAAREVVGLVFDGNIEMLANRFVYRDDIPRSVSVHSAAILESLTKIYDSRRVADELLGR